MWAPPLKPHISLGPLAGPAAKMPKVRQRSFSKTWPFLRWLATAAGPASRALIMDHTGKTLETNISLKNYLRVVAAEKAAYWIASFEGDKFSITRVKKAELETFLDSPPFDWR